MTSNVDKTTNREAGRLGGQRTKEFHGAEHFSRAGELGCGKVVRERGSEFFADIAEKAGQATNGAEHHQQ